MTKIVMPPSRPILRAAMLLEDAVGHFLRARITLPPLGKYESHLESLQLSYLLIRHVEAVVALARTDLVLLPSAMCCCRAAFESAIKIIWMLKPDDPFEQESRWLAHLKS